MVQIIQYPHYLFVDLGGEALQTAEGDWAVSGQSAPLRLLSVCREETAGRGGQGSGVEIRSSGGVYHQTSALIQLPTSCPNVTEGTLVVVSDDAEGRSIRIEGVVLKFDRGQLHCRLWV